MKRGSTQRQNTKPITLTVNVATAICKRIAAGLPIYNRSSKYILIEGYQISKNTYQSWLRQGIVPADAPKGRSLSQMVAKAKSRGWISRAEIVLQRGSIIQISKLNSLPLYTVEKSTRRYSNRSLSQQIFEISPDPLKVGIHFRASIIILSELVPV